MGILGGHEILMAKGKREYLAGLEFFESVGVGICGPIGLDIEIVGQYVDNLTGRTMSVGIRHMGCADTALGAILVHRTVEVILVASIYAASVAFGLVGLTVLTTHAIAETIAIGGLYSPSAERGVS